MLMKEPTSQIRNSETIDLLNYGFTNYKIKTILSKDKDLGNAHVLNGKKENVKLKLVEDATNLEGVDDNKKYTYNIKVNEIKAPVKKGDIVGYLEVLENNVIIKNVDITVSENIKKANIWDLYKRNFKKILFGY